MISTCPVLVLSHSDLIKWLQLFVVLWDMLLFCVICFVFVLICFEFSFAHMQRARSLSRDLFVMCTYAHVLFRQEHAARQIATINTIEHMELRAI